MKRVCKGRLVVKFTLDHLHKAYRTPRYNEHWLLCPYQILSPVQAFRNVDPRHSKDDAYY